MASIVKLRSRKDVKENRTDMRPKSLHLDLRRSELSQSLSSIHSLFNPSSYDDTEGVINGEKNHGNRSTVFSDPVSPKQERKELFTSRFLRSKTEGNIKLTKSYKRDTGRTFTSRFLKKRESEAESPSEDRKPYRSEYLNKKYQEQQKKLEQYSSTRTLNHPETGDDTASGWRAYLDNKARRLKGKKDETLQATGKKSDSSATGRSEKGDIYKSSFANVRQKSLSERFDSSWSKPSETYSGFGSKTSYSGVTSPSIELSKSKSGSIYRLDRAKSFENYGALAASSIRRGSGYYSGVRTSGIADLANDFRSPPSGRLRLPNSTGSSSRSQSNEDSTGRVSPSNERSTRRPSTIIRRPRNQFSPRDSSRNRETEYDKKIDQRTSENILSNEETNLERTKSLNLDDTEIEEEKKHQSPTHTQRPKLGTTASLFLGVSTPDLSTPIEESKLTEEGRENRRKEVEDARRQWRKERSQTTEKEPDELKPEVLLRKPKASYPIDDGGDTSLFSDNVKMDDVPTNEEGTKEDKNAQSASLLKDAPPSESKERRTRKRDKGTDTEVSVSDKNVECIHKADLSPHNIQGTNAGSSPGSRKQSDEKPHPFDDEGEENVAKRDEGERLSDKSRNSPAVSRRRRKKNDPRKSRARPGSMYFIDTVGLNDNNSSSTSCDPSLIGKENFRGDIPKIIERGPSESTDEEHTKISDSLTPQTLATGTRPKRLQRTRPLSLFFPAESHDHGDNEIKSTVFSSGNWEIQSSSVRSFESKEISTDRTVEPRTRDKKVERKMSDSSTDRTHKETQTEKSQEKNKSISTDSTEKRKISDSTLDKIQRKKQAEERYEKEKTVSTEHKEKRKISDSASDRIHNDRQTEKRKEKDKNISTDNKDKRKISDSASDQISTERNKEKQKESEGSSSSDAEVPKYVPIRTIDVSDLLSSEDEAKSSSFRLSYQTRELLKPGSRFYRPRWQQRRSKYSTRGLFSADDIPRFAPLKHIDLSGILSSSDEEEDKGKNAESKDLKEEKPKEKRREEEKKEKEDRKAMDDKEDSKIKADNIKERESRRERRLSERVSDLDTSSIGKPRTRSEYDKNLSPRGKNLASAHEKETSNLSTSTIARRKRNIIERPKSFHVEALPSASYNEYKTSDYTQKEPVKDTTFNSDLSKFRQEIDRLLHKADNFKSRSKLLEDKATTITRSYRDLHSKVHGMKEESGGVQEKYDNVGQSLVFNDLLGVPNTEDEWHRCFKKGILIQKAMERLERQRFQPYDPFYYSDESSDDEPMEDLYGLKAGTSYYRDRRSFNNSYKGCDISGRKLSQTGSTLPGESHDTQRRRKGDTLSRRDQLNDINLETMSNAPETSL